MREILFKAKRKDNGKWVEGYYLVQYDCSGAKEHFIFTSSEDGGWRKYEINPDTISQFTGLLDKNGNKIWENDIVRNKAKWGDWLGRVVFKNSCFVVEWYKYRKYSEKGISAFTENLINAKEIIGNFFDNADLLEVK